MPRKGHKKGAKAPEVWVAPDLMRRMKGADGNRGLPLPQSPYLALADKFLGVDPVAHQDREPLPVAPEPPSRKTDSREAPPAVMAAAAAAGAGGARIAFPKPPAGPMIPRPPRLALPKPMPGKRPRVNPPKPPRLV